MSSYAFHLTSCRLCKSKNLKKVIDLGDSPPPNTLLTKDQLVKKEPFSPLMVNFCLDCGQVQLSHVVSPELMFRSYPYVSSTSMVMVKHFEEYAKSVYKNLELKKGALVVEIGSNDGILLKFFKKLGAKVLGIDPARNIAKLATKEGILTLPEFFTAGIAKKVAKKYGKAKLIIGNNVFAHINNLDEVMAGVTELLEANGAFIVEFPYTVDVVENNVFDSIYHEHLSYLAVIPLEKFFKRFGMKIFDVVKSPVQGGSVRIFVKKQDGEYPIKKSVTQFTALEKRKKINQAQTFLKFAKKIESTKKSLNNILRKLKGENKTIVGYGAPGRSTTLLNYFDIDTKILDYIVDDNPHKQGLYTPGTHIPIFPTSKLQSSRPDYLLILSWNYAIPIMANLSDFKKRGGHFIVPIPTPRVI